MGCRRQALHRLRRLVGTGHPRPRASGCRARGSAKRRARAFVRRADGSRNRDGGDAVPEAAVAGTRSPRVVGHRGDDVRVAARARLHGPREDHQVRRLLPRPRRQPAREGGVRGVDVRPAVVGGRAARDRATDDRRSLQRPHRGRCRIRGRGGRDRRDHRRAHRRQHEPRHAEAGLSRRPARVVRPAWRRADLRRGDDGLSRAHARACRGCTASRRISRRWAR